MEAADLENPKLDICTVVASPFMRRTKKMKSKIYAVRFYEINKVLEIQDLPEKPLEKVIPKECHKFLPLFSKVITEMQPLHQLYDHKSMLQEGFTPLFGPIYSLSQEELQVLKKWI
jgi:hypothetical protein